MHNCIVCENESLHNVIELGYHPLADTFLKKEKISLPQKLYPLNCILCTNCGHLQNEYFVPPDERYIENEYSYTSSNSKISREHWEEYRNTVSDYVNLLSSDHVIEFGSNDGFLLKQFIKKGAVVTGIDPSPYMANIATNNGIYTYQGFVGKDAIKDALNRHGKAKIICGNNVFNHIFNLNEVVQAVRDGLRDDGYFIFESPYHKDIIENYLFDTIYHEHISYFSVRSVDFLFKRNKLYITHIENNKYHGGCIRVYASKNISNYNEKIVEKYIKGENACKLLSLNTYKNFMSKIIRDKFEVLSHLYSLKKEDKKIAAIGAAAKGNTLLNFYKLDNGIIEFVTDSSPHKQGKYTPGSCIPIVDDKRLSSQNIDIALIIAWNIGKYLIEKVKAINKNIKFIIPGEKGLL